MDVGFWGPPARSLPTFTPLEISVLPLIAILLQLVETQDWKCVASGQASSAEGREDSVTSPKSQFMLLTFKLLSKG